MNNKKEMFLSYVRANVVPILVDFIDSKDIPDSIIMPAKINKEELCGSYKGTKYISPKWYNQLIEPNANRVLVIDGLDSISKDEQVKFIELLKYKKVSTFNLPKNTVIIITAKNISKDSINEEVFSLVACI